VVRPPLGGGQPRVELLQGRQEQPVAQHRHLHPLPAAHLPGVLPAVPPHRLPGSAAGRFAAPASPFVPPAPAPTGVGGKLRKWLDADDSLGYEVADVLAPSHLIWSPYA